jgi:hypothetical protein
MSNMKAPGGGDKFFGVVCKLKQRVSILMGAASLFISAGCATKIAHAPTEAAVPSDDSSYMDLQPGTSLRILVPILTSGRYQVTTDSARQDGVTMVLSASNLVGYEVSYYAVEGRNAGRIRLKFRSAELTKDAKTIQEKNAPPLPFAFPAKAERIRLIYLVRSSRADHNMAIAASKDTAALNAFTDRVKANPAICELDAEVFCTWIPAGIAVRPE